MRNIWVLVSNLATAWGLLPATIAAYVTTSLWVVAMAVVGFAQGISLFWIMLGLPLAGASIATLILRASEWRERQRVSDKITFAAPRVLKKLKNGKVEAIILGFQLNSHAAFPVTFEVDRLETSLGGMYPPKKAYAKTTFSVPAGGTGWFDDNMITVTNPPAGNSMQGDVHFAVKYGVGSKLRYTLEKRIAVFLGFDANGDLAGSNWQEL